MANQPRPSNHIVDGLDWLFGTGGYAERREREEDERRAKLTKWQRRREDAVTLLIGTGIFIGAPAITFGPWLLGSWVILRWLFGGRS